VGVTSSQQTGNVNVTLRGTMSATNYTVTVTDSGSVTHTGTVSSGSTTVTISGVPVGNCTVTITSPDGYIATATPSSFALITSGQAVGVTSIQQTGNVNVTLSGIMSAANYTVTVTDSESVNHTGTINSGSTTVMISGVLVGNCTVTVTSPDGYAATATPSSFALTTSAQAVGVTSSQQTGNVNVTLSGIMSTANYTVTVTDSGSVTHTGTVSSGSTKVMISGVLVGICTVTVTSPDGYIATATPSSFTLTTSGKTIRVTTTPVDQSIRLSLINLDSAAYYVVTVENEDGKILLSSSGDGTFVGHPLPPMTFAYSPAYIMRIYKNGFRVSNQMAGYRMPDLLDFFYNGAVK